MKHLESLSLTTSKHCDYYEQKIAELSLSENLRDQRMLQLYRRLLIRDRSLLHNLELLKLSESMHLTTKHKFSNVDTCEDGASAPLNLNEFRHLLDENREAVYS